MCKKITSNISPLRYPGGKTKLYSFVKELIKVNQCKTYIEPYAGGAGVALKLLFNNDYGDLGSSALARVLVAVRD